ncbi:EF-hand domain-containing protein [Actinokineospora enzanensis]|uniref:EF-hand domain-containing protein n=1 Tax=Actinokineospora enzanensis TaxID=155975 RepID=UPI00036F324E|nr:EF-hand domain-containing protein [Actinokineospora enzanensis]
MASGFQRDKVAAVFAAMDHDGDQVLTESDFAALADRWTRVRGCAPDSADHHRLTTVMLGWWHTLRTAAAADHVTLDDVLTVVDQLPAMPSAVAATAEAMFDAVDTNADGTISADEYRTMIEAWNGRPADTATTFARLDLDSDGHLSRAEFTTLWTQFWSGNDPTSPGTWIFGDFPRTA